MPLIQVTAPAGALSKKNQDSLMTRVSNAVLRSEGADTDDPAALALVWGTYSEPSTHGSYVGGESLQASPLIIAVTTPAGALDQGARQTLVKDIGEIVDDLVGPFEGRLNHWAMLYELDEGSWGGGSQIFRLADIQQAMNIKPKVKVS